MHRFIEVSAFVLLCLLATGCVLHVSHYSSRDGDVVYVGDVYNEGPPLGSSALVEGKFYDADGNLIATELGETCQGVDSKKLVPFKVTVFRDLPESARVEWSVHGTPVDKTSFATGLTAEIGSQATDVDGTKWISGQIRNTSINTYYTGSVCVSWTNAAGDVIRVESTDTALIKFPPGKALPFLIVQDDPPSEPADIHFYLDAGVVPPGQAPPTVITLPGTDLHHASTVTFPFPTGSTGYVTFGEVQNTSATTIAPPLVSATSRDASGKLVASATFDICPIDVAPGSFTYVVYVMVAPGTTLPKPEVAIEAKRASGPPSVPLTTANVTVEPVTGIVTGVVRNTSGKTVTDAIVCVGGYNGSGGVDGVGIGFVSIPPAGLLPGGSANFAAELIGGETPLTAKAVAAGFFP